MISHRRRRCWVTKRDNDDDGKDNVVVVPLLLMLLSLDVVASQDLSLCVAIQVLSFFKHKILWSRYSISFRSARGVYLRDEKIARRFNSILGGVRTESVTGSTR